MPGYALGLIETLGLTAAIEATDAALKSANVRLVGYELATGGLVTVKIEGEVSAVDAAVRSGSAAASRVGQVHNALVIARPHAELDLILLSEDNRPPKENIGAETGSTAASEPPAAPVEPALDPPDSDDAGPIETVAAEESRQEIAQAEEASIEEEEPVAESLVSALDTEAEKESFAEDEAEAEPEYTCNLCHDPMCKRKKGQPRTYCINYK